MKSWMRHPLVLVLGGVVVLGAILAGLLVVLRPQVPVSAEIRRQLTFPLLYTQAQSDFPMDSTMARYNAEAKVLFIHAKTGKVDLTITEQATPDPINDIPGYLDKMAEKLHSYASFDSLNGKVYLTKPEELKGAQSAVFSGKGVLMFVTPSATLTNDEWRKFFNSLVVAGR